jgi:hypothetical protein
MALFLISYTSDDGDDLSLFVADIGPLEALKEWSTYFELNLIIEKVFLAHQSPAPKLGDWVYVHQVPDDMNPGVKDWTNVPTTFIKVNFVEL